MQVDTERGMINIKAEYKTQKEAQDNGYYYSFTSHRLNRDVYGKCLDDRGLYHEFVTVYIRQ